MTFYWRFAGAIVAVWATLTLVVTLAAVAIAGVFRRIRRF